MRQTYDLAGQKDFYFPHPVRVKGQIIVEIRPGGVVSPFHYEVIGAGPRATGVTVCYPDAPTEGELILTRYTAPERTTVFLDELVTARALNAEFDNIYHSLEDFTALFDPLVDVFRPTALSENYGSFLVSDGQAVVWREGKDIHLEGGSGMTLQDLYSFVDGAQDTIEGWRGDVEGWHSAVEIWHPQVEQWRQDTWDYKTSAEGTINQFESGYTGFNENHGYDFGSVTTAVTYFNRDFGGLS